MKYTKHNPVVRLSTSEEIQALERFDARERAKARIFHEFDDRRLVKDLIKQLNDGLISSVEFASQIKEMFDEYLFECAIQLGEVIGG